MPSLRRGHSVIGVVCLYCVFRLVECSNAWVVGVGQELGRHTGTLGSYGDGSQSQVDEWEVEGVVMKVHSCQVVWS